MKAKITGSLFLLSLVGFMQTCQTVCDLQVKILDQNGQVCSEVSPGVPFQLHFVAKGDCDVDRVEFSSDFEICKLNSLGTVKSVSNINRVVNHAITHRYLARIDHIGKYSLGPVKLHHGNTVVGILNVEINVTKKLNHKNINQDWVVELKTSKQDLYVGEQFEIVLRFYFNDTQLAAANLNIPDDLKELLEFEVSKEVTQMANYLEWRITAEAKKTGKLLLPAFSVIFEKVSRSNQFFMFHNREQHEQFSNAVMVQVNALPNTKQIVQGIGVFTNFTAQIDKSTLEAGKAVQLNLKLEGQGNWSKIHISPLNVPTNLHYYAGSVSQTENAKTFEFVLQGVQTGDCQIPAQTFFYFDTSIGNYKTISSNPVKIKVLSVASPVKVVNTEALPVVNDLLDHKILPITEIGAIKYRIGYVLPAWFFLSLGFLPILVWLLKLAINCYQKKRQKGFKSFKKELVRLEKNNSSELLYTFFLNIFEQKFKLPISQINAKTLDQLLASYAVPVEMRTAFNKFYNELAATAFSKKSDHSPLFARAMDWLNFLEGVHAKI